jgi:hypothetical protein
VQSSQGHGYRLTPECRTALVIFTEEAVKRLVRPSGGCPAPWGNAAGQTRQVKGEYAKIEA